MRNVETRVDGFGLSDGKIVIANDGRTANFPVPHGWPIEAPWRKSTECGLTAIIRGVLVDTESGYRLLKQLLSSSKRSTTNSNQRPPYLLRSKDPSMERVQADESTEQAIILWPFHKSLDPNSPRAPH